MSDDAGHRDPTRTFLLLSVLLVKEVVGYSIYSGGAVRELIRYTPRGKRNLTVRSSVV
jgi:hypothetical protein